MEFNQLNGYYHSGRRTQHMCLPVRAILFTIVMVTNAVIAQGQFKYIRDKYATRIAKVLEKSVMKEAAWAMSQAPETVTAAYSLRSTGGRHDFFSEGDYWWPGP
jgi:hypothetical protein